MREDINEIKISLARIETSLDSQKELLTGMREARAADREDIDTLKIDMESGKAQVRLLKWFAVWIVGVAGAVKVWLSFVVK